MNNETLDRLDDPQGFVNYLAMTRKPSRSKSSRHGRLAALVYTGMTTRPARCLRGHDGRAQIFVAPGRRVLVCTTCGEDAHSRASWMAKVLGNTKGGRPPNDE